MKRVDCAFLPDANREQKSKIKNGKLDPKHLKAKVFKLVCI